MTKSFARIALLTALLAGTDLSTRAAATASRPAATASRPAATASRPAAAPVAPAPPASRASHALRPAFSFDHAPFDALLARYVGNGRVRYASWKASAPDRASLDRYIALLTGANLSGASREERLAFWLNAYNAVTIKSILDAYPVRSIREIPRVWDRRDWDVAGERVSLNLIEHEKIRPVFRDARVHFALVCAAKGCPPLPARAFRPETLERDLASLARAFLNDPARAVVDVPGRRLRLSPLFDWYRADFESDATGGAAAGSVAAFVARYRNDTAEAEALRAGRFRVEFLDYDWSLNE